MTDDNVDALRESQTVERIVVFLFWHRPL